MKSKCFLAQISSFRFRSGGVSVQLWVCACVCVKLINKLYANWQTSGLMAIKQFRSPSCHRLLISGSPVSKAFYGCQKRSALRDVLCHWLYINIITLMTKKIGPAGYVRGRKWTATRNCSFGVSACR